MALALQGSLCSARIACTQCTQLRCVTRRDPHWVRAAEYHRYIELTVQRVCVEPDKVFDSQSSNLTTQNAARSAYHCSKAQLGYPHHWSPSFTPNPPGKSGNTTGTWAQRQAQAPSCSLSSVFSQPLSALMRCLTSSRYNKRLFTSRSPLLQSLTDRLRYASLTIF